MLHSRREIELIKNYMAQGILEVWEVVTIFAFLLRNQGKEMCHIKHYKLQLPLAEGHGDVLGSVNHELLEVQQVVFDKVFAFPVKNQGLNICHALYFNLFF